MSTQKTIRFDSFVIDELENTLEGRNFSQTANLALRAYVNNRVWISNIDIHEFANLSAKEFASRMSNVECLRCSEQALQFTLYPSSKDEIEMNRKLFDYANGRYNNVHDQYVIFSVKFPVGLFLYLKTHTWEQIEKTIHGFLALLYWNDRKDRRQIMEAQIESDTMRKVIALLDLPEFEELSRVRAKRKEPRLKIEFSNKYLQVLLKLGIEPTLFPFVSPLLDIMHYPFDYSECIQSQAHLNIKLEAAYMRNLYGIKDDWQSIILNGTSSDKLHRSESREQPLKNWLGDFDFYNWLNIHDAESYSEN